MKRSKLLSIVLGACVIVLVAAGIFFNKGGFLQGLIRTDSGLPDFVPYFYYGRVAVKNPGGVCVNEDLLVTTRGLDNYGVWRSLNSRVLDAVFFCGASNDLFGNSYSDDFSNKVEELGIKKIRIVADPNNVISETNELNNTLTFDIFSPTINATSKIGKTDLPNLRISRFEVDYGFMDVYYDDPLLMGVTLVNRASNCVINPSVLLQGLTMDYNWIDIPYNRDNSNIMNMMFCQGSKELVFNRNGLVDVKNFRQLRMVVDPDNEIPESNESDNSKTINIRTNIDILNSGSSTR